MFSIILGTFSILLKTDKNYKFVGLFHFSFGLNLLLQYFDITVRYCTMFVLVRITDEGLIPEMRIWSTLVIRSDLKIVFISL